MKPTAWKYQDAFGTAFTEDFNDILDGTGVISWTELYERPAGLEAAVVGRKHFGNPIPPEWYAALRDIFE